MGELIDFMADYGCSPRSIHVAIAIAKTSEAAAWEYARMAPLREAIER